MLLDIEAFLPADIANEAFPLLNESDLGSQSSVGSVKLTLSYLLPLIQYLSIKTVA